MERKSHVLLDEIENMIRIIEDYNLSTDPNKVIDNEGILIDKTDKTCFVFKDVIDDKTFYNVFYDNIHVRIESSIKEKVYSIHLKTQDDSWAFNSDKKGNYCFTHPKTETFRVYVTYDVPVLNIDRAIGESYINGSWDRYLYNNLDDLFEKFYSRTATSKFNISYNEF